MTLQDADAETTGILTAAMDLAAVHGWRRVSLLRVAERAGVTLAVVYRHFPSRVCLLVGVSRLADAAVLANSDAGGAGESPRDRLFDVMMRRFDALRPFRAGLAAVMRDVPLEPGTALAFAPAFARSMGWMLRAAGIDPDGRGGVALVAGLGVVDARVMRVFAGDDSADLSRTMAALDSELARAESMADGWFSRLCLGGSRATATA